MFLVSLLQIYCFYAHQDLEFHGVMRFYFQDAGLKVVTKCIRVSSKTTVGELMDTLIEKFCPDMKMLTPTNYELFEVHEKGGMLFMLQLS